MKLLKKRLLQDNSPPKRKHNYRYLTIFKPITIMKTIKLFFITTILFTISANSQITKGNWMVGGNASLTSVKNESEDNSSYTILNISLSPNIGYFVFDKFSTGILFNYKFSESKSNGYGVSRYGDLGPFARYYFLKNESRTNVFLQSSYNSTLYNEIGKLTRFETKAGTSIFLNSSVGLEVSLAYSSSKYNPKDNTLKTDNKSNALEIAIGLQIHLEKE